MRAHLRVAVAAALVLGPLSGAAGLTDSAPAVADDRVRGPVGGPALRGTAVVVDRPAGVPAPPSVASLAYVVADATTGQVLAAKAPHLRLPPASTLKVLTALTLLPRLAPTRRCTASDDDANIEGSKAGVVPGGTYTVRQLWQAVFLRSGNDAVSCLVTLNGGGPATLAQMRTVARRLGALDTSVANATGLDAPGQLTSAYDLALLGRAAVGTPAVVAYASTVRAPFPGKIAKPRPSFQLWTQQKFVLSYEGALGIKNGFTSQARNTLVAASSRGSRTVLVTLLRGSRQAWREAAALSDWAYAYGQRVTPVGRLVDPGEVERAAAAPLQAAPATEAPDQGAVITLPSARAAAGVVVGDRSPGTQALLATAGLGVVLVGLRGRVLLRRRARRLRNSRAALP